MDIGQIILIVVIVLLIIAYPIMVSSRNKKERQKLDEQTNSLKRGDKIMTTSGIVGTIVDLHQEGERKIVTIETGTAKNKGYMSIDAYAIYSILNDNFASNDAENKNQPKVESNKESIKEDKKPTTSEKAEETKENNTAKTEKEVKVKERKSKKEDK